MIRSSFPASVICCLLIVGCGSQADSGKKDSPNGNAFDWKVVFENWESADAPARLAIMEEHSNPGHIMRIESHIKGKTAKELKEVFGEPNTVTKDRLTGHETFKYYMGSTTQKTPFKERDILSFVVDKEGIVISMSVSLKMRWIRHPTN